MKYIAKWLMGLFAMLVLCGLGYVGYLYFSYNRLPDQLEIEVADYAPDKQQLQYNQSYQALTYNIGFGVHQADFADYFLGGKTVSAKDRAAVLNNMKEITQLIQAQGANFLMLQEVDQVSDRTHQTNEVAFISQTFAKDAVAFTPNWVSKYLLYPLHSPIGETTSGLLTLSSHSIAQAQRYQLPVREGLNRIFELDRAFAVVQIPLQDSQRYLELINVDLAAFSSEDDIQQQQLAKLYQYMVQSYQAGNYIIVAGDFKQDMLEGRADKAFAVPMKLPKFKVEDLPEGFVLANEGLTDKRVASVRDGGQVYQPQQTPLGLADGFIVSDNISVESVRVVEDYFVHSYHQPVVLKFQLRYIAD